MKVAFGAQPHYAEFMRQFIPEALKALGRARPKDLERYFQATFGFSVDDGTLRRYADRLVEEGILRREIAIDHGANSGRRPYRMVWYLLR